MRPRPHRLLVALGAAVALALLAPSAALAAPKADPTPSPSATAAAGKGADRRATFGIGPARACGTHPSSHVSAPGGVHLDKVGLFTRTVLITPTVYPADLSNTGDGSISAAAEGQARRRGLVDPALEAGRHRDRPRRDEQGPLWAPPPALPCHGPHRH